jgi:hypothetical protein
MAERQEFVAVATISDVEHNMSTGWYKVVTDKLGKLSTKWPERAQQALDLKGSECRIRYTEGRPSGNVNPHTGQPYPPDKFFESAEPLATGNGGGGFTSTGGSSDMVELRGENPEKTWRIALQVGGHLAVDTLPLLPNEQRTFEAQKQIALAWAKFFYFTPVPPAMVGSQMPPPSPQAAYRNEPAAVGGGYSEPSHPGAYDEPPPHTDDDIPY